MWPAPSPDWSMPAFRSSARGCVRGVNDRVEILTELYERLIDLRVMPYYLHHLDPVAGAAHFEVTIAEGKELIAQLRKMLPGYAVPRYVRETKNGFCKEIME